MSVTGIGLLQPAELPLHGILLVAPCEGAGQVPLLVARVLRAAAWGAGWYHGCDLRRRLTARELERWLT